MEINQARARHSLSIRANCLVDRLIFDGARVTGVRLTDGTIEDAESVALCAGAIGSPAILMRSGIGPRRELERLGIGSTIDLPGVGARLWDHAAVPIRLVPLPGECVIGRDPRLPQGTTAKRFSSVPGNVW
jgi:choline dehydrogenase